jgi:hypothetical protein
MKDATLHSSLLIVGTAAAVFACTCSTWFTVANTDQSITSIRRLRGCEAIASIIVISHGIAASREQGSSVPGVVAVLMTAVFVGGYEYAIRSSADQPITHINAISRLSRLRQ